MNQKYSVISLPQGSLGQEQHTHLIQEAMERFGCGGIEEYGMNEEQVDALLGERSYSGGDIPLELLEEVENSQIKKVIKFYFHGSDSEENAYKFSNFIESELGLEVDLQIYEEQDWGNEWRKFYTPIEIGKNLWVVPSWQKSNMHSSSSVYIYPGQGFGTGGHQTTFLCLKAFLSLAREIQRVSMGGITHVLDYGCGSGILGIASGLILGRDAKIDLYDIDLKALENATQNIQENSHVLSKINIIKPQRKNELRGPYQLIFANILAPILMEESSLLCSILDKGGYLILSGMLQGQEDEVLEHYAQYEGVSFFLKEQKDEWVSIVLRR